MKKAIRILKRGSYSIDLLEMRKQAEAGTLPITHRRIIERIMSGVLPTVNPLTGKLKTNSNTRTTHPNLSDIPNSTSEDAS